MRIVTWNCKGALHKKISYMSTLLPDILIIPESERIDSLPIELEGGIPSSVIWQGNTPRKGLAIIAYGDYHIEMHPRYVPDHKWVVPIIVSGPSSFLLLAVWTLPMKENGSYIQPLLQALECYQDDFGDLPVIWAGDFNANFNFDTPRRQYKFRDFVSMLEERDIISLYHSQTNSKIGEENDDTFFLYHHRDKGYHIDYFFASSQLRKGGFRISMGSPEEWLDKSDHLPVICDIHTTETNQDAQATPSNH